MPEKAFGSFSGEPIYTSTPLGKAETPGPHRIELSLPESKNLLSKKLTALQVNRLCFRNYPSLLRAPTKEGLAEFDFKK